MLQCNPKLDPERKLFPNKVVQVTSAEQTFSVLSHPSLLIDVRLKGHLHRYKLHQIFQFFMGSQIVPLLKRRVWRFFRAGPNGPSPPTHFWQQNSAIPPPSSLQHDLLEIQCSHWLKLLHSDWRENLVKDFFVKIDFPPIRALNSFKKQFINFLNI